MNHLSHLHHNLKLPCSYLLRQSLLLYLLSADDQFIILFSNLDRYTKIIHISVYSVVSSKLQAYRWLQIDHMDGLTVWVNAAFLWQYYEYASFSSQHFLVLDTYSLSWQTHLLILGHYRYRKEVAKWEAAVAAERIIRPLNTQTHYKWQRRLLRRWASENMICQRLRSAFKAESFIVWVTQVN